MDDATLRHLAAGSEIADLVWEAPDELTAEHGQMFHAAICAHQAADSQHADELWEKVRAIWSQAWSANYAALEFLQGTGLTRFSPVEPQHWVVASFEHHTSPHGLPRPHIHNIVITSLTAGVPAQLLSSKPTSSPGSRRAGISESFGPITGRTVESCEVPVVKVIVFHAHADERAPRTPTFLKLPEFR